MKNLPIVVRVMMCSCVALNMRLQHVLMLPCLLLLTNPALAQVPETVRFNSEDGKTKLVGFLFLPVTGGPHPAVVMMHGRRGPYSILAKGVYSSSTLTKRHQAWGHLWADRGYVALLVDSFGPRGYPAGFERGSYDDRPSELNEVTIRPLDAYGALKYLRSRRDVIPNRIVLQGWSNGGSATLASMATDTVGINHPTPETGFRAGLALYPGCGLHARWADGYMPYAPVAVLIGSADEEVSPKICGKLVAKSKAVGAHIDIVVYPGAEHDFDDPGKKRQGKQANREATLDAFRRSEAFVNRFARE